MAAHKGHKKAGGRKAGTPNKVTLELKEVILTALSLAEGNPDQDGKSQTGAVPYLKRQSELNPTAFMGLVGKVLPLQVTGANGGPLIIGWDKDAPDAPMTITEAAKRAGKGSG